MALRWSSEFVISELQDLQADTIALDYDGNTLLLAGRRYLALKRLNDQKDQVDLFPRNQKYDASVAEWNLTSGLRHHFAVSCNERVVHASVGESGLNMLASLKHHTRKVTHLNWHQMDPNELATASADCTALIWDPRDTRRPVVAFSSIAGVNQVRWNKVSSHLLATAQDGDLRIWDQRKPNVPIQYIAAHSNKIHCIDWSQTHEYQLVSCSHDGTVKLFDVTNPKRAESIMHTTGPVWRVSYTPWGEGLMSAVIPNATEESTLQLWNISSHSGPVHSFVGPRHVVLEAQWRKDGTDYQLITWSVDQCLRVWRIEPFLQRLCGSSEIDLRKDSETDSEHSVYDLTEMEVGTIAIPMASSVLEQAAPLSATSLSFGESIGLQLMEHIGATSSLEDEFEYLTSDQWNQPFVYFENMDIVKRSCFVVVSLVQYKVSILISFPPSYPYNAAPSFQIEDSSLNDPVLKTKLLKLLKQTAQQRVRKNRTCVESCLSQIVSCLEGSSNGGTAQLAEEAASSAATLVPLGSSPARLADPASVYSSFHDAYIPYPRYSGARFCSVGMLVCFGRAVRAVMRHEQATPRSLSAATTLNFGTSYPRYVPGSSQDNSDADFSFFLSERQSMSRALSRGNRSVKLPRNVTIYDTSKLFLINKELAEKYLLHTEDIPGACAWNCAAAAAIGRSDLVQVWTLASLASCRAQQDGVSWSQHPFSSTIMEQIINHYTKISDIQTAAMLSCVYPNETGQKKLKTKDADSSPYHTIHPTDTSLAGWVIPVLKHHRSNSWSESNEDVTSNMMDHRTTTPVTTVNRTRNVSVKKRDELKKKYGDIAHMWGLMEVRTTMMKLIVETTDPPSGSAATASLEFLLECQNCARPIVGSAFCSHCLRFALRCALCRVLVRGASNVCLACGHGGHAVHMQKWFLSENGCPSGCGCKCASETRHAFDS